MIVMRARRCAADMTSLPSREPPKMPPPWKKRAIGDVVRLTAKFTIALADYGIVLAPQVAAKIAKDVTISLSTYAIAK